MQVLFIGLVAWFLRLLQLLVFVICVHESVEIYFSSLSVEFFFFILLSHVGVRVRKKIISPLMTNQSY